MGCGKSKHDVTSDNTVLQRKKSNMNSQENGAETKDTNNNIVVDKVSSSEVQVEQKGSENVKEFGVEAGKDDVVNDVKGEEVEKTNVEEEKKAEPEGGEGKIQDTIVVEEESEKSKNDDSLKENEQKINDADDATEENEPAENEKDDVSVKEEEGIKDTNVSTSEGEEKDLKAEEDNRESTNSQVVKKI